MSAAFDVIGEADFDGQQLRRPGVWAVAFVAGWCPFCHEFLPHFAALRTRDPNVLAADVSSYTSPLWDRFAIDVVPTVLVFVDGRAEDRFDGIDGVGLTSEALDRIAEALERRRSATARPPAAADRR